MNIENLVFKFGILILLRTENWECNRLAVVLEYKIIMNPRKHFFYIDYIKHNLIINWGTWINVLVTTYLNLKVMVYNFFNWI